MDSTSIDLVGT